MSVDPPQPNADSDDDFPRRANDTEKPANDTSSGSSVPPTETLRDAPTRLPKTIGQFHVKGVIASGGMGPGYLAPALSSEPALRHAETQIRPVLRPVPAAGRNAASGACGISGGETGSFGRSP